MTGIRNSAPSSGSFEKMKMFDVFERLTRLRRRMPTWKTGSEDSKRNASTTLLASALRRLIMLSELGSPITTKAGRINRWVTSYSMLTSRLKPKEIFGLERSSEDSSPSTTEKPPRSHRSISFIASHIKVREEHDSCTRAKHLDLLSASLRDVSESSSDFSLTCT